MRERLRLRGWLDASARRASMRAAVSIVLCLACSFVLVFFAERSGTAIAAVQEAGQGGAFRGQTQEMHTMVPASAVMHMHDRDFVFIPEAGQKFRRLEVVSGDFLPDNTSMQEITSGLEPGQQVVTNALVLDHVLAQ